MPRWFEPISIAELDEKIRTALEEYDSEESGIRGCFGPQYKADLSHVQFDEENLEVAPVEGSLNPINQLLGMHELDDGLTFCGQMAGGDWEHPVFYVTYWDGANLRAYVPIDGNPWNTDTGKAYGNNEDADRINFAKRYPAQYELLCEQLGDTDIAMEIDVADEVEFDPDEILKDIRRNLIPRPAFKLSAEQVKERVLTHVAQRLDLINELAVRLQQEDPEIFQ